MKLGRFKIQRAGSYVIKSVESSAPPVQPRFGSRTPPMPTERIHELVRAIRLRKARND